jgi:hypothetical protein
MIVSQARSYLRSRIPNFMTPLLHQGKTKSAAVTPFSAPTGFVPHPAGVPAQHGVFVPEQQQLGVLRTVTADHQDSQAE